MTLQEIEKAAKIEILRHYPNKNTCLVPRDFVVGLSCHENDYCRCEMEAFFIRGANLVMERVRKVEEVLKRISAMPHDGHEESWAGICNCPVGIARAVLEGK